MPTYHEGDKKIHVENWGSHVDKMIREAQARGDFDNLPGMGQPLQLEGDNPFNPEWSAAFRVAKNAGAAPLWVQLDKEIGADAESLAAMLDRTARYLESSAERIAQRGERGVGVAGREQHLDELLRDRGAELPRHRPVERDDAAVGRDRIGGQCHIVGREQLRMAGNAAGDIVLDDRDRRIGEAGSRGPGSAGVQIVVVGHFLAAKEPPGADAMRTARRQLAIEDGLLVGILAVAKFGGLLPGNRQLRREFVTGPKVGRDDAVVRGNVGERLGGQFAPPSK